MGNDDFMTLQSELLGDFSSIVMTKMLICSCEKAVDAATADSYVGGANSLYDGAGVNGGVGRTVDGLFSLLRLLVVDDGDDCRQFRLRTFDQQVITMNTMIIMNKLEKYQTILIISMVCGYGRRKKL